MSTEAYISNGLRYIKPYYNTHSNYVKGRWIGKPLVDVLTTEFRSFSRDHYIEQIAQGNYQLKRDDVSLDVRSSPLRSGDVVTMRQHKHEPPVKQWCDLELENCDNSSRIAGFEIVQNNDRFLVINKPVGIPVHPTGQFYHNTITEILKDHGQVVSPCYRLDKVTSGLLILAKNNMAARDIQMKIGARDMNKIYLARVRGRFPHTTTGTTFSEDQLDNLFQHNSITTVANSPIYSIEPKKRFPAGLSDSKEAKTIFYPIRHLPETNESIVACKPLTGRTHQIRIHLARLGFPIVNDSIYNTECTMYSNRLQFMKDYHHWEHSPLTQDQLSLRFQQIINETKAVRYLKLDESNGTCKECGVSLMADPQMSQLELYLHAWRYYDNDKTFNFKTELPKWA